MRVVLTFTTGLVFIFSVKHLTRHESYICLNLGLEWSILNPTKGYLVSGCRLNRDTAGPLARTVEDVVHPDADRVSGLEAL